MKFTVSAFTAKAWWSVSWPKVEEAAKLFLETFFGRTHFTQKARILNLETFSLKSALSL